MLMMVLLLTAVTAAQQKKTKVSFKEDVMPVLQKKCMNCHNTEDESPSGLYLDDYSELMKGESKHGPVIKPKKGEESVLIMKLRGTTSFGKQMPRGKKQLDDETIEMISTWIDQGAKNN
jgi:uncharacterized membrane protein